MRYPLKIREAIGALRSGAHTVLVVHGPREWAWGQVNAWSLLSDYAVLMCPPDVDPGDLDWTVLHQRSVILLGWSEAFDEPNLIAAALLAAYPRELHAIDMSNPWALPAHYQRTGDGWITWTGLGPREETKRHEVTALHPDPSGSYLLS